MYLPETGSAESSEEIFKKQRDDPEGPEDDGGKGKTAEEQIQDMIDEAL